MDAPDTGSVSKQPSWRLFVNGFGAAWSFILWVLEVFCSWIFQATASSSRESSAPPPISPLFRNPPRKVNDSLYELHKPSGTPSMQILFFHGLLSEECGEHCASTMDAPDTGSVSKQPSWRLFVNGFGAAWSFILWVLEVFCSWIFQATASSSRESSAPPPISPLFRNPPRKVNDSLYELHKPSGTPSMQILFFHGLLSEECGEAHWWTTWESGDKSCIWPEAWLVDEFPHAQIFFVTYGGIVKKASHSSQSPDLYIITENLISDLMDGNIGQIPHCPVVMVGHCVGGIVIKQLCLQTKQQETLTESRLRIEKAKLRLFLGNVKGVFYYDTPHHGTSVLDKVHVRDNPLLGYFQTLSKAGERLNFEFGHLRASNAKWRIYGLGASSPPKSGPFWGAVIVGEPSGRGGDFFNVMAVDHYAICKPPNKETRSFYALKQFLNNVASDNEVIHLCHDLPKYLVGLEKPVYDIQVKLTQAKILGIIGMGGVGKTTIAKRVFNNISREFEYTCFVNNVKSIKICELEEWLLSHFHHNGRKMKFIQWSDLKDKKTLIVVDDVDLESQLQFLRALDLFGSDSHLIITTRDRGVLDIYTNCGIYEVSCLAANDAKRLFCKHLFDSEDILENPHSQVEEYVMRVVEKCQGLPLTLEVMGCYLRRHIHDARFWEATIEKLGNAQAIRGGQNDRVWASLKLSYDALSPEEKEMFIDACTFFFEAHPSQAFCVWSKMYKDVESTWANLLNTSMVKEVHVEGFELLETVKEIWVHEQLRDLAKTLGNGNMIVADSELQCDEIVDRLNAHEVKAEARSLQIICPDDPDENQKILRLDSLNELQNLKYLYLSDVRLKQPSVFNRKDWFKARKTNFPKNLFFLSLRNTLIEGRANPRLPITLEEIRNVAFLNLRNWRISKELFGSLGKLLNLGFLSLVGIEGLDRLPENFGNLPSLKWLSLDRLALSRLPDSLCNLSSLEYLFLSGLNISELPESFGNLISLRILSIDNCKLTSFPDSFGRLSSLEVLGVVECESLKNLPHSLSQLPKLQLLEWTSFDDSVLGSLGWVRQNIRSDRKYTIYRRKRSQEDSSSVPLT